jgi:hypothetical protein
VLGSAKTNGDTPPMPQRPSVMVPPSNRNSMLVSVTETDLSAGKTNNSNNMQTLSPSGSNGAMRVPLPTSAYAPKITSILDNSVVWKNSGMCGILAYGDV